MPGLFHLGWAFLLVLVALGLLSRKGVAGGWLSTVWQVALAGAIVGWGGWLLGTIARDHGPGLELESLRLAPNSAGAVVLGSDEEHVDVVLPDPHVASVHAVLGWDDDGAPVLRNVSATHRLEVDGDGLHDTPLETRTEITVGRRTLEVAAPGLWPGLLLVDDRGEVHRLRAPVVRGLMSFLPVVGPRIRSTLGWLLPDGDGYQLLDQAPLPGTGPAALLLTKGRTPWLAFPTAEDRAEHPVVVDPYGSVAARPADRAHRLTSGEVLTLGRTRYGVAVTRGGEVTLRTLGAPPRIAWPEAEGTVLDGVGAVLLSGDPDGQHLVAASLSEGRGFRLLGGLPTLTDGGRARVEVPAGSRLRVEVADGAVAQLRVASRAAPALALAGLASVLDARLWALLLALAACYLAVTLLGARLGYVHARNAGVVHGAALLVVVGLACLYRLSDPGNPLQAGWALHQARLLTVAAAGAMTGLVGISLVALLRRRRGLRPIRGDLLFRWLEGPDEDGRRAKWLYWLAVGVLLAQLPFGEAGIALPGLGSVQPIELARTLLVVYLAFWTSRALDEKRARLRGPEGLTARWAYMVHTLPILVVLGLCYLLHDISPILVFGVFLAVFYALSLMRPSLRVLPLRALPDHVAVDLLAVGAVLGLAGWLLLGDPNGTVARRIAVWWDPWNQTAEAYQAMTALWATASGGLWGTGWTGANGVLPPAVRDDFILALLAARGGAAAVTLVAATFAVVLLSGAASIGATRSDDAASERRALLAGGMLWMLVIQAAIVLGSATGGLPVMGQPLPFIAAAGSHLLFFCLPALATVLACTRLPVAVAAPANRPRPQWALPQLPEPSFAAPISLHGPFTEGGA